MPQADPERFESRNDELSLTDGEPEPAASTIDGAPEAGDSADEGEVGQGAGDVGPAIRSDDGVSNDPPKDAPRTSRTSRVSEASPRMRALAREVVARPMATVVLVLLMTLLALIPLQDMNTQTSMEDYIPSTPEVEAGQEAHRRFPLDSTVITVAEYPGGNPLSREGLAELVALEAHLAGYPQLQPWLYDSIRSISSPGSLVAGALVQSGYDPATVLTQVPEPQLQATLSLLIGDPQTAGLFGHAVNDSGGWTARSVLVAVMLDKQGEYNDEASELIVKEAIHAFPTQRLRLNTLAAASQAMDEASSETLATLLPVSFCLMALLLYVSLRRVTDVVLSLLTVLLALIWMFGAGALLDLGFSQYTFIAPILVLALGVDDAIHILHRYRADYEEGRGRAMTTSIGMVGTALLLTSLTTMAAFGANRISEVPALRDFGIHVALGIGAAFILTTTFLPAIRLLIDRSLKPRLRPLDQTSRVAPLLGRLVDRTSHHGFVVILVALLITAGSLWVARDLEQELEMVDLVQPDSEIQVGYSVFVRDFSTTSGESAGLLVTGEALARPEVMEALLAVQAKMADDIRVAQLKGQPRALSIADYARAAFPAFATANNLTDADSNGLPDTANGTRLLLNWLVANGLDHESVGKVTATEMRALAHPDGNGDFDGLLVQVVSANIGTLGGGDLLEDLEGDITPLEELGLEVTPFGVPIERYQMLTSMTDGMLKSVIISIGLCLVLLMLLRRSLREGLEAILPVLLVAAWVYGTIWALGWSLNVVTVSIAAITIGVGVDFAVHLLHRYRESRSSGLAPEPAVAEAVRHAGQPLVGATATTMAGFGVLYFSPMNIFSQFGLLTALMVLYSLVAALVVLPVVILKLATRQCC